MAGKFQGWLIKFGEVQLPNSFLLRKGWESVPNQRMELDAYRDANVLLHRETASDFKTKLKLNIREMTLLERMAFDNVISLATLSTTDKKQRKVTITYWNDEILDYVTGVFYMTDTTYVIDHVDEQQKDIEYDPFSITLIEY